MTTTPPEMLLTDDELLACLVEASCLGTVRMSFEIGPYYIDRPTINATLLAEALQRALLAKLREQHPVATTYTMEALVPGGEVKCHASFLRSVPADTKLYAAPVPTPAQAAQAVPAEDSQLLDFLAAESLDLRCFTVSDDDVGWRTVQHHQGKPVERVASEVYRDDPRQAIREAMQRSQRDPYCTGPLHQDGAAPTPTGAGDSEGGA